MGDYRERFIPYSPVRDVVFVLGGGASRANGVPGGEELLPYLLTGADQKVQTSDAGRTVIAFLKDHFHIDPTRRLFPSLDGVLALLEHLIAQQEPLGARYPFTRLVEIRDALLRLVHHFLLNRQSGEPEAYRTFWKTAARLSRNVSVVTLNFDTRLDAAFGPLYPNVAFLDYCLPLMNYDHAEEIDAQNWWVNPRALLPVYGDADPRPIKVIKLNGSLNWRYCPSCQQVLLTPWDQSVELSDSQEQEESGGEWDGLEGLTAGGGAPRICPVEGTPLHSLVVPRADGRTRHPVLAHLAGEAAREWRKCRKVVFMGYSLPDSHVQLKSLLIRNMNPRAEVIVVKAQIDDRIRAAFLGLRPETVFIQASFQEAVADADLMRSLFT